MADVCSGNNFCVNSSNYCKHAGKEIRCTDGDVAFNMQMIICFKLNYANADDAKWRNVMKFWIEQLSRAADTAATKMTCRYPLDVGNT